MGVPGDAPPNQRLLLTRLIGSVRIACVGAGHVAESRDVSQLNDLEDTTRAMAQEYFDRLSALMEEVTPGMSIAADLEIKHFFSGAAVYADGRICMSITPAGFAVKLPEPLRNALLKEKGTGKLRYFPKAPIKKDYVVLSETILSDKDVLRYWLKQSIEYVLKLPKSNEK
jgi:TfoX/Sxy family transcriptional regulator of competence genes